MPAPTPPIVVRRVFRVRAVQLVLTAELTEHSLKLILYCDMPAGLHIDARHSHAIPNWRVHGASILI